MKETKSIAANETLEKAYSFLRQHGPAKFAASLAVSEKKEFNTDPEGFSLLRTTYGRHAALKVFQDGRMGLSSGNDLSEEGLTHLLADAMAASESAEQDEAHDLAPDQGARSFQDGVDQADLDGLFARTQELLESIAREYPRIKISNCYTAFTSEQLLYVNTNGTRFDTRDGFYEVMVEFSGNDGQTTTGLDGLSFLTDDLKTPFLDQVDLKSRLKAAEDRLAARPLGEKFVGTVILMPDCLEGFAWDLISNYLSSGVVLDGTSQWLDKLGQKTADEKLTIRFSVSDPDILSKPHFTGDGYLAEDVTLIQNGTVKSFLLNLYTAKKTNRPVTKNDGAGLIIEGGETPLEEMIKGVSKGLLVGSFSGGAPGSNGEFSGVAKNSVMIENGKLKEPVTEAMISGNLADMFGHIEAVSKKIRSSGDSKVPYMAFSGITISGKV